VLHVGFTVLTVHKEVHHVGFTVLTVHKEVHHVRFTVLTVHKEVHHVGFAVLTVHSASNVKFQNISIRRFCVFVPNNSPIDLLLSLEGQYQLAILIDDINMAAVIVICNTFQSFCLVCQHTVQLDTLISAPVKFQLRGF
jgi:acetolactate synthase regulatory subunit